MSRLTAKVAETEIYARLASSDEFDIIQKLGEYEDTGLEPSEVKRLAENYRRAQTQAFGF